MQTITNETLKVLPDFQQNGVPITVSKYCTILRGYKCGDDEPVLVKMVGGEIDQYLNGTERTSVLDSLHEQMEQYHRILGDNGVVVSKKHSVHRTTNSVLEITIDGGPNVHTLLQTCTPHEAATHIKGMLECTMPILENPDIGLDTHPGNFAVYRGKMRYIDFLPARYRTSDNVPLVGIPQPPPGDPLVKYLYQRYYQSEGILRRLWFTLALFERSYVKLFFKALEEVLTAEQYDVITSYLRELPFNRMRELQSQGEMQPILDMIEGFGDTNIDDIRESSTLFCKPTTRAWVNRLTGIDLFKPVAERNQGIAEAKSIIMDNVRQAMSG